MGSVPAMPSQPDLLAAAHEQLPDVVDLRRELHRHPELGLDVPRTQERVLDALAPLGLATRLGTRTTSIVADLEGTRPGPTLVLRADMDALPLDEDTGVSFPSEVPGAMHACGHDAHTAMLVGAARLLHARRDALAGRVRFMFQPGEEGPGGAEVMLDEGLLDDLDEVTGAFAIHVTPAAPAGMLAWRPGAVLASADQFRVVVRGRGGHGSSPHEALDPIPIACQIVLALQTAITREISVFDPAVLTVGRIRGGTVNNVIPEVAQIDGTLRAVSPRTRAHIAELVPRVASNVAAAHRATAEVAIDLGYGVTANDPDFSAWLDTIVPAAFGEAVPTVVLPDPAMGAEDFSFVLDRVPGAMVFLGVRPEGTHRGEVAALHSNRFELHEPALATGMALHAAVALARLAPA